MTVFSVVRWRSCDKFQQTAVTASTVTIFNCPSCNVSGMLLKSLLDIILMRIPWSQKKNSRKRSGDGRMYLFALSLLRLRRLRVSLFHFNEWTISVPWITLAKMSDDALRWQRRWRECAETKLDLQSEEGDWQKTRRMTRLEKLQWMKVSCDTKERSREANETNRRKGPLCRGQLWSWNDAWKNISLSLVSTQFVMSFTHSFERLEKSHKTICFLFVLVRATLDSPAKWQIQTNDAIKASYNLPNSIEVQRFYLFVVLFGENSPTTSLWLLERSHPFGPKAVRKIHKRVSGYVPICAKTSLRGH